MPLSIRKKGEAAKLPEGMTGRVQLSPERIQLAGIKTETVQYRPMAKQTKTVGYIAYDETPAIAGLSAAWRATWRSST